MAEQKTNIETLKKISFDNLPQFISDLNTNMAIIQNSPLFKGVIGNEGNDGNDGARGERGSRFLFVNIDKFSNVFGKEVVKGSDVNITFLNNKLVNFNTKKDLLKAFDVTEFVDKDVVVLTDSVMLNYDVNDNLFVETNQAFNPENNFVNNIEQTIETIVKKEVENNPVIKNATNVFDYYTTLAKNYSDNNSSLVTDKLLNTSVYSPYINNYVNKVGIEIKDHTYFGYTDERFPITDKGTMVFGSIKLFYKLLMDTIAVDGDNALTSDYAVGVDNIPSLILLQDTYNNGLMLGFKGKKNLKSFGSIFKNDQNELVLKSDSSKKDNEFSELKLHSNYMKYNKRVDLADELSVGKNFKLMGNISNDLINTGIFSTSKNLNDIDLGKTNGTINILPNKVNLTQHKGIVLVTDINGTILKQYRIETMAVPEITDLNLYNVGAVPNNKDLILTSNYFQLLAKRFNSLSTYVKSNYWRKDQFNNGEISDITLSNSLTVKGNTNLADLLVINKGSSLITVKSNTLDIDSQVVKMLRFKNVVLVTNLNGEIISTYQIGTQDFSPTVNQTNGAISANGTFIKTTEILTSKYYNILVNLMNAQNKFIVDNYWRKNQFNDGTITDLTLSNSLKINKANLNVGGKFIVTDTNTTINNPLILASDVTLNQIKGRVVTTDVNGKIVGTYVTDNSTTNHTITDKTNTKNNQKYQDISVNITTNSNSANALIKHNLATNIIANINAVISWVNGNFWRKDQFNSGEISDIKTTTALTTDGNFNAGNTANRNITTNGTTTTIGANNGITNVRGNILLNNYSNGFVFAGANGTLNITYKMSNNNPKVSTKNGTNGTTNNGNYTYDAMYKDYWLDLDVWVNGSASIKGVYDVEVNGNNILNGKHFNWVVNQFGAIAKKFKEYYTKTEVDTKFSNLLPIGTVIDFYGEYSKIPDGWSICDGRVLMTPNGGFYTPDLINKYTKGINGEAFKDGEIQYQPRKCGDIDNGEMIIRRDNLPDYLYTIDTDMGGLHQHDYKDSYWIEQTPKYDTLGGRDYVGWMNGSRGQGYDKNSIVYWRGGITAWGGNHKHRISFSLGKETPLQVNPKSFGMYKIIKYK